MQCEFASDLSEVSSPLCNTEHKGRVQALWQSPRDGSLRYLIRISILVLSLFVFLDLSLSLYLFLSLIGFYKGVTPKSEKDKSEKERSEKEKKKVKASSREDKSTSTPRSKSPRNLRLLLAQKSGEDSISPAGLRKKSNSYSPRSPRNELSIIPIATSPRNSSNSRLSATDKYSHNNNISNKNHNGCTCATCKILYGGEDVPIGRPASSRYASPRSSTKPERELLKDKQGQTQGQEESGKDEDKQRKEGGATHVKQTRNRRADAVLGSEHMVPFKDASLQSLALGGSQGSIMARKLHGEHRSQGGSGLANDGAVDRTGLDNGNGNGKEKKKEEELERGKGKEKGKGPLQMMREETQQLGMSPLLHRRHTEIFTRESYLAGAAVQGSRELSKGLNI